MIPQNFLKLLGNAALQVLIAIGKLFMLPFNLWVKSICKLSEQREQGLLSMSNINGLWPFLTFCKRILLDFVFEAIAFLAYPLGIISAFAAFISSLISGADYMSAGELISMAIGSFMGALVVSYFIPAITALLHDIVVLFVLLPIRKIVNFMQKPAQQLDIDVRKHECKAEVKEE